MEDWSDCFNPDALRIRLDIELEENAELREEIARLHSEGPRVFRTGFRLFISRGDSQLRVLGVDFARRAV
ncbi:hypothetical protein, partial [Streptomyces sp. AK02-04a]|uniref:hypothetical protein n=1 Tax=Streptomyces sp. AK02-04a TaxID=3028649 RepID=UPI0029A13CF2|nr:hypothetical protein [Streptomyces sp. AK02-04a]